MRTGSSVWVMAVGGLLATGGCGGGGGETCSADALAQALADAAAGDVVEVGACTIEGNFTVPPGVILAGAGPDRSTIATTEGVALRLEPSVGAPTTLRDLAVRAGGRVGVLAVGNGEVAAERVTVIGDRGYAFGVEAANVTLSQVDLVGPVNETNHEDEAFLTPNPDVTATYGLVLLAVGEAQLSNLSVRGFAAFGVAVLDRTSGGEPAPGGRLTWDGGLVSDTLGTGVYVSGGVTTLSDLEIIRTHRGLRGTPTYGAVFTGDADVTTVGLRVCDNADFGILQEGGRAVHTDLEVCDNGTGGLLAGNAQSLEVSGAASTLTGNGAGNIILLDSRDVTLRDAQIGRATVVRSLLRSGSIGDAIDLGDGIQLVGTHENVTLENLVIADNERVGLLVDLGLDGGAGITFTNVTVRGTGAQLGAIGGIVDELMGPPTLLATPPDGTWDMGITREGDVAVNDAAWSDRLDVVGIITPSMMPRPSDAAGIITPSM